MKTRALNHRDIPILRAIHEKYYKQEFDFPDFLHGWLGCFAITEDDGTLLIGGGIKPLAEAIILTDKEQSNVKLGRALIETIQVSRFICSRSDIRQLHAFVTEVAYKKHLLQHGFEPAKGDALVLSL